MRIAEYKHTGTRTESCTVPIPAEYDELPEEQPTQQDRIEAQAMYTALMTDTLLEESEEA